MIIETSGDLLLSNADILVNPVNCVGIMGKGLALQFKQKYPKNFTEYAAYCRKKNLQPGQFFLTKETNKIILNLATKNHWSNTSYILDIDIGLAAISDYLSANPHLSIAIPAIGCGLGQLSWSMQVKPLIFNALKMNRSNRIFLYTPEKV